MASRLNNEEISRYGRQLILPEIGVTGLCMIQKHCKFSARKLHMHIHFLPCLHLAYVNACGRTCPRTHHINFVIASSACLFHFSHMRLYSGQLSIKNSAVLIVGCGGLGCPIAQYLAAAGIGMSIN